MSEPKRIHSTIVIVGHSDHAAAAKEAGAESTCVIDPNQGPEQIMRGDAVRSEIDVFEKVILALPEGCEDLRDEMAIRIGDERCKAVTWLPGAIDGADILARARPMWTDEIATIDDIPDSGPEKTYMSGFPTLDEHGFRFVLPAFMSLVGPYASGKSVLLRQVLVNLWRLHGFKFLLTSFEERVKPRYQRDLRRHLIGRPIEEWTDIDVAHADSEIRRMCVFLRRKRNAVLDLERLLSRIEYGVRVYGVKVVAIDPVNEIDHLVGKGESKTDYMGRFIMSLKALADDYGLLIIVCAHPPKDGVEKRMQKKGLLTLNDAADTAHYGNKSDIGWCAWRNLDGPTLLHIDKLKDHETMGSPTLAELHLNKRSGQFQVSRIGYDIIGDDAQ